MTEAAFAARSSRSGRGAAARPTASAAADPSVTGAGYAAGRCNIGPAEIARRRRFGHLGLLASAALFLLLLASDAPHEARLLLFFPAAGSAIGYLQARLRFCAAFGLLGIFNFGALGEARQLTDRDALARDRRAALAVVTASAAIGAAVALGALLL